MKSDMNDVDDRRLAASCKAAMPADAEAPQFDATFANAERLYRASRRQKIRLGVAAAFVAVGLGGFVALTPDNTLPPGEYIKVAELMSTTRWTAPSDVLLPRHEIDLYQELPVILESTQPAQGALL